MRGSQIRANALAFEAALLGGRAVQGIDIGLQLCPPQSFGVSGQRGVAEIVERGRPCRAEEHCGLVAWIVPHRRPVVGLRADQISSASIDLVAIQLWLRQGR